MQNMKALSNIGGPLSNIGGKNAVTRVNELREQLLQICEELQSLNKEGIRVEFNIVDCKLAAFRALQEMKLSS